MSVKFVVVIEDEIEGPYSLPSEAQYNAFCAGLGMAADSYGAGTCYALREGEDDDDANRERVDLVMKQKAKELP